MIGYTKVTYLYNGIFFSTVLEIPAKTSKRNNISNGKTWVILK